MFPIHSMPNPFYMQQGAFYYPPHQQTPMQDFVVLNADVHDFSPQCQFGSVDTTQTFDYFDVEQTVTVTKNQSENNEKESKDVKNNVSLNKDLDSKESEFMDITF